MKTREIQGYIRSMGFEAGVVHVLQAINEDIQGQRQDLRELGKEFLSMIETMEKMVNLNAVMRDKVEKVSAGQRVEDDLDPNTQGL